MPMYMMHCDQCGDTRDIYRSIAQIDHDLPGCCGTTMRRLVCAPAVIGDIPTYQAVAVDKETGKMPKIEGRAQHREFLRRNGYVEMGNDIPTKPRELLGDYNVRPQLAEAVKEVLAQQRK